MRRLRGSSEDCEIQSSEFEERIKRTVLEGCNGEGERKQKHES